MSGSSWATASKPRSLEAITGPAGLPVSREQGSDGKRRGKGSLVPEKAELRLDFGLADSISTEGQLA